MGVIHKTTITNASPSEKKVTKALPLLSQSKLKHLDTLHQVNLGVVDTAFLALQERDPSLFLKMIVVSQENKLERGGRTGNEGKKLPISNRDE